MKNEMDYYLSTENFHAHKKSLKSYPDKQENARVALSLSPIYEYNFKNENLKLSIKPPLTSAELASLITCKLKKLIIIPGMSSVDDHYTLVGSVSYTEPEPSELKSLNKLREESFSKAEQDEKNWIKSEEKIFNAIFEQPGRIFDDQKNLIGPIFSYADASKHQLCKNFYQDLMQLADHGGKTKDEKSFVRALNEFVEEKITRNYSVLINRWKKDRLHCIVYENEQTKEILNFEVLVNRLLRENAVKTMAVFAVVARQLSPDCVFYKGGKKKNNSGNGLLRAVMKLCSPDSPDVMQYVCIKIQPRRLKQSLENSDTSPDRQSSDKEKRILPPSDSTDNSPVENSPGYIYIWNQPAKTSFEVKSVISEKKDDFGHSTDSQSSSEEEKHLLPSPEPTNNSPVKNSLNPIGNQSTKTSPDSHEIKQGSLPEEVNKSNFIELDPDTFIIWYRLTLSPYYSLKEKQCLFSCLQQLGKIPSLNDIQQIKNLPTDYSKLVSTVGTFKKPKASSQPSTALPASPATVIMKTT